MNRCAIIGCGPTAKFFSGGFDSIGVNDAWKHKRTGYLLTCDPKRELRKGDRLEYIMACKPLKHFYYYKFSEWGDAHNAESYHATKWSGRLDPSKVYTSMSSPFAATCMAISMGYDLVVIYGADYYNHKNFTPDRLDTRRRFGTELKNFKELSLEAFKIGVGIFVGHRASALSEVLKVWRG